jgi:predicted acylesterase/phospholipase RssA
MPSSSIPTNRVEIKSWSQSQGIMGVLEIQHDNLVLGKSILALHTGEVRFIDKNYIRNEYGLFANHTSNNNNNNNNPINTFIEEEFIIASQVGGAVIVLGDLYKKDIETHALRSIIETEIIQQKHRPTSPLLLLIYKDTEITLQDLNMYFASFHFMVEHDFIHLKDLIEEWCEESHRGKLLHRKILNRMKLVITSNHHHRELGYGPFFIFMRPILLFIFLSVVFIELIIYILIVSSVVLWEKLTRRYTKIRTAMKKSTTYSQWKRHAGKLDVLMGLSGNGGIIQPQPQPTQTTITSINNNNNHLAPSSPATKFIRRLEEALQDDDIPSLVKILQDVTAADATESLFPETAYVFNHRGLNVELSIFSQLLEQCISRIEHDDLYFQQLLFQDSVVIVGGTMQTNNNNNNNNELLSLRTKLKWFELRLRSFGTSALCLSGGACNGFFHLGAIRALLDEGLLPSHVSGASAGALVGAFVCCRTESELREALHNPKLLSETFDPCSGKNYFEMMQDLRKNGSIFNPQEWMIKMKNKVTGELTFAEAYKKTGRSLTLQVFDGARKTRHLNHLTAPNVLISSAVIASSAIPLLLPPIQLLHKTENGDVQVFSGFGISFRDGSFEKEFPFDSLARVFNATHTIVSQVNPHLIPFFYENRGSSGSPVPRHFGLGFRGGFFASILERALKSDMKRWLTLIDEFRLLPNLFSVNFSRLFLGDSFAIHGPTLVPPVRLRDYLNIAQDPDTPEKMMEYVLPGMNMAFPKMQMIQDRMRVEHALQGVMIRLLEKVGKLNRHEQNHSSSLVVEDSTKVSRTGSNSLNSLSAVGGNGNHLQSLLDVSMLSPKMARSLSKSIQ